MKNYFISGLFSLLLSFITKAQNHSPDAAKGYKITGHIAGYQDSTLLLAHWYGSTSFIPKDTAVVNNHGDVVFDGKTALPEGLYLVVPRSKRDIGLHLIVTADQQFSFETDTANIVENMVVKGSEENELFYAYQHQLAQFNEEGRAINQKRKGTNDTLVAAQLASLTKRAGIYQDQFLKDHANTFAVKLFKATAEPTIPQAPKTATGRPDSNWVFNYYKAHYWDGYDWTDERLIRTPVLQNKLAKYVADLTVQSVDSLIRTADWLVDRAKVNKEVMSYTIWYITSQYERPKVLGTDGLFIRMAEKYWLTGIYPVSDTSTLKNMRKRVAILKPLQVGKILPAMTISDTLQRAVDVQKIRADYTVVFFYAPHCGHCRDTAPKLKKFSDTYKSKGVEVLAVAIDDGVEDWKKFIREFKLATLINGYDYRSQTNFHQQYDVVMTPTIYVLDKTKKIIARQLPFEQLEDFLLFYQKHNSVGQSTQKTSTPPN